MLKALILTSLSFIAGTAWAGYDDAVRGHYAYEQSEPYRSEQASQKAAASFQNLTIRAIQVYSTRYQGGFAGLESTNGDIKFYTKNGRNCKAMSDPLIEGWVFTCYSEQDRNYFHEDMLSEVYLFGRSSHRYRRAKAAPARSCLPAGGACKLGYEHDCCSNRCSADNNLAWGSCY